MKTNPALPPVPASGRSKWVQGVRHILQAVLLPHFLGGLGLCVLSVYAFYTVWVAPWRAPGWLEMLAVCMLLTGFGILFLGYILLASGIYTLYEVCILWEDFIEELLDQIQTQVTAKLKSREHNLPKVRAKKLVRAGVREVFQTAGRQAFSSLPRWAATVFLGGLVWAVRSVLTARIAKWSGRTVQVSKIFAGKATLSGAVFLNLRFFSLLLLVVVYAAGAWVLCMDLIFVFWKR